MVTMLGGYNFMVLQYHLTRCYISSYELFLFVITCYFINFACRLKKLIYSVGLFPPTWAFISNKNLIKKEKAYFMY